MSEIHELDPQDNDLKHDDGTPFSSEERYAFFEKAKQIFKERYKDNRANVFSSEVTVGEQLDMLWHELDTKGKISKEGNWYKKIKEVKESNPKDDTFYQEALSQIPQMRENNKSH